MYGPRLSKEEIDMLLAGICEGRLTDEAADVPEEQALIHALSGLERVNPAHLPGLDMINRRICRDASVSLADFAGRPVDVVCEGVEVKEYRKLIAATEPVETLCVFAIAPLSGQGTLIIEPMTADMLVDAYFGGRESFQPTGSTPHASLSRATLGKVEARLMDVIRSSWAALFYSLEKGVHELPPLKKGGRDGFEPTASQRHPIADAARVYISSFKVSMSGGVGGFCISIPVDSIKPVADRLVNTCSENERAAWAAGMAEGIYDAPVNITVEMGTANITVEDLLSLKSGDIIETDRRVKDTVDILIDGMPLLTGLPGAFGSRYAIRVAGENILTGPS